MSVCGLQYSLQITGDCSNSGSGSFYLSITGNAPDYTIQYLSPTTDVVYLGNGVTDYTASSLTSGTYLFEIYDTCAVSGPVLVSLNISSGTCISCTGVQSTNNNDSNGAITAQTSNVFGTPYFYLYETTNGYQNSATSVSDTVIFQSLSAGTYYVVGFDGGGCSGSSESVIIKSSTTFDYGFYIVEDSGCGLSKGKIFITGLTGDGPYTFLWNNGEITQSITGVSSGNYSVTVTDKDGVEVKKKVTVGKAPTLSYMSVLRTPPTCYSDDGEITFTISGGSPPYNYQLSNGISNVSFLTNITIPNLSSNYYTMTVTDAGNCTITNSFSLLSPRSFVVTSLNTKDTTCGNNQGSVSIRLIGGQPPFSYVLTNEFGETLTNRSSNLSYIFSNLYQGTYTLTISDLGPCVFEETVVIGTKTSFILSTEVSNITCINQGGSVLVEINGDGIPPYTYKLTGQPTVTQNEKSNTFTDLKYGNYLVSVNDSSGCTQSQNIIIGDERNLNFNFQTKKTKAGNDGQIEIFITDGKPPFDIVWSQNVGSQTGKTLTNLSAGTYDVTITDGGGCVQKRSMDIDGQNLISSYQVFNVCDNSISSTGVFQKKGLQQMLLEGFYDLTSVENNCLLNQAIFSAEVLLSGVTSTAVFYTSTSLNDFPFDNEFYNVVEQILMTYEGIDNVIFDSNTNQVTINSGCDNQTVSLIDFPIQVSVKIEYDITCESCQGASLLGAFPYTITEYGIFGYDPENKIFITLPESDKYTNVLGITRNSDNTKLWVLDQSGDIIFEYDVISLIPYIVDFNRNINLSSTVSRSLTYVNSTTLYSGNDSSPYLASIDISSGVVSNGIFLSTVPFTVVDNTLLVNTSGNTIVLTHDVDGFQYLRQYDSVGGLLVEINLPATIGYTMYEYNSIFYLVDLGNNQVYSIQTSSPYTLTAEYILEPPVNTSTFIMSQINTYITTNFI